MSIFSRSTLIAALAIAPLVLQAGTAFAQDPSALAGGTGMAYGTNVPGWTGSTLVAGSHSTIAGDQAATTRVQTGQY